MSMCQMRPEVRRHTTKRSQCTYTAISIYLKQTYLRYFVQLDIKQLYLFI